MGQVIPILKSGNVSPPPRPLAPELILNSDYFGHDKINLTELLEALDKVKKDDRT